MKLLKSGFKFYINSSIHVALAVTALTLITVIEFSLAISKNLYFFIFFGTISAYNFVKYAKIPGLHHRSLTNSLKSIQIFSFLCFGMTVYFLFTVPLRVVWAAAGFGALTFFYAVPLLKHKNLRTIAGIKIVIVGLVWAGITVILPLVAANAGVCEDSLITFIQRLLLVIVLTIPFEIRDVPYDAPLLKTLPQLIGIRNVKIAGTVTLGFVLLLELFKEDVGFGYYLSLFLVSILTAGFLVFSRTKQAKYYASFWVEAIPIVWYVLFCYIENFF